MSIMPGAVWRPITIPGGNPGTRTKGRAVVLHVAASEATSLFGFFNNNPNANSHFYVAKDGTCLTPDMRVLTSDLRWVPGGDVKVGDRLAGFDETGAGRGSGRRYHEATVEWVERDTADVYAVVMDDERIIYTTADHRWLAQTKESWTWRQTKDAAGRTLVGARIPRLFDPWETREDYAAGWFAGFLDGEGTLTAHHRVGFSQRPTDVLARALAHLESEGLEYTQRGVKQSADCQYVDIRGTLADRMALLGSHRPIRLLQKVDIESWGAVRSDSTRYNTVVAVYPAGRREIVKMQTSTRTFIAEGFGMHNCEQYVDTDLQSWASMAANKNTITVETQGGVTNADAEPWTPAQVAALGRICAWAHATEGIPLTPMPDSLPTSRGIGYHRLGIKPWVVAGGEIWSGSTGKLCPGAAKIAQIPAVIAAALGGDDDMPYISWPAADKNQLCQDVANAIVNRPVVGTPGGPDAIALWLALNQVHSKVVRETYDLSGRPVDRKDDLLGHVLSTEARVKALADKQAPAPAPVNVDPAALAAALLADEASVAKLGDAIAAGLAKRVGNG